MNRLQTTALDRGSLKRAGVLALAVTMALASYLAFTPSKARAAACAAPSADYGVATNTVTIPETAMYQVWSRMSVPNTTSNSYLLEIDGNTCFTVGDSDISANTWTWVGHHGGSMNSKARLNLTAGSHTIKMIGREAGVKVGRVLFVSDLNCTPTGNGDNCLVSGDTQKPNVTLTAPSAGATVSGTVNATANASDNVGVKKVEFWVNGTLHSTDTAAPYTASWNTTLNANGPATLFAKAYDTTDNTNSSATVSVTVANGDTQAPSTPGGVTATADSATKVTVKWNASTDNRGVTGYRVLRNGQTLAQVTSGLQYVDQTVVPNTAYSYRVTAYDQDGNVSAASSEARVTTPTVPDIEAPTKPEGVSASAANSRQINVRWTASRDNVAVAAYDVFRSVDGGSATRVATLNGTSYGDTGLSPNTTYIYYVVAKDAAGNTSQNSSTASAKTPVEQNKTGAIKGKVTFRQNRDRHAHVIITVDGSRRIYDTDRRGNYLIRNVPSGTYSVRYEARGSYSKVVTVKVEADKTKTQNVTLRRR